jgi:hypothetical protein
MPLQLSAHDILAALQATAPAYYPPGQGFLGTPSKGLSMAAGILQARGWAFAPSRFIGRPYQFHPHEAVQGWALWAEIEAALAQHAGIPLMQWQRLALPAQQAALSQQDRRRAAAPVLGRFAVASGAVFFMAVLILGVLSRILRLRPARRPSWKLLQQR